MPETHPFIPANQTGKWYFNNALHLGIPQPRADWFVNEESFAFMPNKDVKSLFLGTFPTYEVVNLVRAGGNTEFFYGQRGNGFWQLLQQLSGVMTGTEINQFQFLHETKFGLTDIIKEIERNEEGSTDKALTPLVFNNIMNLRDNFRGIDKIYCTSGGKGRITRNGPESAARWLLNSLEFFGYTVTGFNVVGYQKDIEVSLNKQLLWRFKLIVLHSPSANANRPLQRQMTTNPMLAPLIAALPPIFGVYPTLVKLRIAQWSYLLSLGGFPLTPPLNAYVSANLALLVPQFA